MGPACSKTTISYYLHWLSDFSGVAGNRRGMFWEVSNFEKYGDNFTWQRHVATLSLLGSNNLLQIMNLLKCFRGGKPPSFIVESVSLNIDVVIGCSVLDSGKLFPLGICK